MKSEEYARIVVSTGTYNMAHTLPRLYASICKQKYPNFFWLIVDDGSSDNTQEIVEGFIAEGKIEIEYVRRPHISRTGALNHLFDILPGKGEFFLIIDADDELTENVFEEFEAGIKVIRGKKEYWAIVTLCGDIEGKIAGKPFPPKINVSKRLQKKEKFGPHGERLMLMKVDYMAPYRWPIVEGVLYYPESLVWMRLHKEYSIYCENIITRIYHQDSGIQLSNMPLSRKYVRGQTIINAYEMNHYVDQRIPLSYKARKMALTMMFGRLARQPIRETLGRFQKWQHRALGIIALPIAYYVASKRKVVD